MPQQVTNVVENNFTKGLITESTGLNFPENAATDTDNCVFDLIGEVFRRLGVNYEDNFSFNTVANSGSAITTFKWDNAGGDGSTQIVVTQIGNQLNFYRSSSATTSTSLSSQLLASTVSLSSFVASGGVFDVSLECQYAVGNGYLFVFHPSIDPIYCTYSGGTVTPSAITIQIRDFVGALEPNVPTTFRPLSLTNPHNYNLVNQGWSSAATWNFQSSSRINSITTPGGSMTFNDAPSGMPIHVGDPVLVTGGITTVGSGGSSGGTGLFSIFGTVFSYSGNTLFILISSFTGSFPPGVITQEVWYVQPANSANYISQWNQKVNNYPSNADVWWRFKNSSNVFDPANTIANVTLSSPAPNGSLILNAFKQDFQGASGTPGLGTTQTTVRPRTGAWFQGRVFYAGVDASQNNAGPAQNAFYTWTENIYFSQVVTNNTTDFGKCYQTNDPTSEDLFDLLPTDGGVITIPGCGAIYKLFPIQNGMLVFAANGVWFLTGSQGIGFTASDYTIVKLSEVQSISGSSFVNVQGLPYFWNEEGIYQVMPQQSGSLSVEPLTVGTILTFFNEIPAQNRRYARGMYDPINYIIQWIYRSTPETGATDRYQFDRVLNYNTYNKSFYPYTVQGVPNIRGIIYVASPGGSNAPDPVVKFFTEDPSNRFTFAEENDERYVDFFSHDSVGEDYTSFFITGYKIRGQAIRRFQPQYINVYSKMNGVENGYLVEGIWNYATSTVSNKFSTRQLVYNIDTRYATVARRHKIRGRGLVLQFKISSISGLPFDIQGWAVVDTVNSGA